MIKNKILHICNNYWANSLYGKMISHIANSEKNYHEVFVPIRKPGQKGRNNIVLSNVNIVYELVATTIIHRLVFSLKSRKALKMLYRSINVSDFHMTHSHSLFSDGVLSYKIFKKENIKYIVTIRNTDINIFLKYFPFLKNLGRKILRNASHIVFISPSYVDKLINYYPELSFEIKKKKKVLPNGINEFWLNNITNKRIIKPKDVFNFIYVGEISPNKNIHTTIEAVKKFNAEYEGKVSFKIIGKGKNDNKQYLRHIENLIKNINGIEIYNAVPKEELVRFYNKSHIFIMPSLTETFGLVYAEALTQGLPIIYTKHEGFHGFFEEGKVGYAVDNPKSANEIFLAITKTIDNFDYIQNNISFSKNKFSWKKTALKYNDLYKITLNINNSI